MRAILIDPIERIITEVEYDNSTYKNISKAIGADCFDIVIIDNETNDTVYVDDEGLCKPNYFFQWVSADHLVILAGKGLILSVDEEGETRAAKISLEDVQKAVRFITANEARQLALEEEHERLRNLGGLPIKTSA